MESIRILDSYKTAKKDMAPHLQGLKEDFPLSSVWKRSFFSLKMEWVCHNFLFSLHLWRDRTKDVDLNYPNKAEALYILLGLLVYVFVK